MPMTPDRPTLKSLLDLAVADCQIVKSFFNDMDRIDVATAIRNISPKVKNHEWFVRVKSYLGVEE